MSSHDHLADSKYWFPKLHEPHFYNGQEHALIHFALGLAGEVGEVANEIKKWHRGDFDLLELRIKLKKELPDIYIYLQDLASILGINMEAAVANKHAELCKRWGTRPESEPEPNEAAYAVWIHPDGTLEYEFTSTARWLLVAAAELGPVDICTAKFDTRAVLAVDEFSSFPGSRQPYNPVAHILYGLSPLHGKALLWMDSGEALPADLEESISSISATYVSGGYDAAIDRAQELWQKREASGNH